MAKQRVKEFKKKFERGKKLTEKQLRRVRDSYSSEMRTETDAIRREHAERMYAKADGLLREKRRKPNWRTLKPTDKQLELVAELIAEDPPQSSYEARNTYAEIGSMNRGEMSDFIDFMIGKPRENTAEKFEKLVNRKAKERGKGIREASTEEYSLAKNGWDEIAKSYEDNRKQRESTGW